MIYMKNSFLFIACVIISLFTSCSSYRYIYSASPPNNPSFTEKGQSKFAGYYSTASDGSTNQYARGVDLQGAYAVSNHFAVSSGYFHRREEDFYVGNSSYQPATVHYKRNLFDLGSGYFIPIDKKKKIILNLYAGYATGKFTFTDDVNGNNGYHESAINKWFFQPSLNFIPGKSISFSFAARFSNVHYGKINTNYPVGELQYFGLAQIANRSIYFFEPSVNILAGAPKYPWIKVELTASTTSNYNAENSHLDVRRSSGSIGLNFDFSKMKRNN
jgi:hypothetical protein